MVTATIDRRLSLTKLEKGLAIATLLLVVTHFRSPQVGPEPRLADEAVGVGIDLHSHLGGDRPATTQDVADLPNAVSEPVSGFLAPANAFHVLAEIIDG